MSQHHSTSIEQRLSALGIVLPTPAAPVANYVGAVLTGTTLVVSGQLCFDAAGKLAPAHTGKMGDGATMEDGQAAARLCVINVLAQVKAVAGSLDRVSRCVRLGGFINCRPDFASLPQVMNGASDLMVEVFGDAGRHARSTIGVAQLPLNALVEVEGLFEIH